MRRNSQKEQTTSPQSDQPNENLQSFTTLSISPVSLINQQQSRSATTSTDESSGHDIITASRSKKKPYLKKHEKSALNNSNTNKTEVRNELRRVESIQFEKKALHTKLIVGHSSTDSAGSNNRNNNTANTYDDDYFYLKRIIHPNLVRKAVSSSTRRPPLRCLLDSGEFSSSSHLAAAEDQSAKFQAFVLSENFSRRRDFVNMFDRNADDEFPIRQKEIYNRFRSGVGRRKRDLGPVSSSVSIPPEFELTSNTKVL